MVGNLEVTFGRFLAESWIGVAESAYHHLIDCVNTVRVLLGYEVADGTLDQIQNARAVVRQRWKPSADLLSFDSQRNINQFLASSLRAIQREIFYRLLPASL